MRKLKQEQLIGLLFVLALHGLGLYGLWRYGILPTPSEAATLMVHFIAPPAPEPEPEQPKPPEPSKPRPVDPPPPVHIHLAVETPVVLSDEPAVFVPPPEPVAETPLPAPPQMELPSQPVTLSSELSVICPERTAPYYPMLSKRMNEQGKVILRVELGEDGKVTNATIKESSSFTRLDDAALATVKTWRCKPTMRNGVAVHAFALQPFDFILSE
ncbi:MAG: energy transducer TonB [Candidatus Nitrotoga sp.]